MLQAPEPSIKPGYAITGNRAFLETGSPASRTFTHGTPLGNLTIAAQGTFYVDWGDGTPRSGPFDTSGAAYPNGTITHVWEDTGRYTVTVYEQWTATWSLGGQTGTLTGLQTTGTLPNFEVRQLESVRNR
ncbi:MAG TPA: hypothetical protein VFP54_07045 [Acidimicrobiales bacterium]|nr:hypothetical protein [Acidimicrobiales bacterium]